MKKFFFYTLSALLALHIVTVLGLRANLLNPPGQVGSVAVYLTLLINACLCILSYRTAYRVATTTKKDKS